MPGLTHTDKSPVARLARIPGTPRPVLEFTLDGEAHQALEGDTVLTAMLTCGDSLRAFEFGAERRAGFCMMGACQDCWVRDRSGRRMRACTTFLTDGMSLVTGKPGDE